MELVWKKNINDSEFSEHGRSQSTLIVIKEDDTYRGAREHGEEMLGDSYTCKENCCEGCLCRGELG